MHVAALLSVCKSAVQSDKVKAGVTHFTLCTTMAT